MKWSFLSFLIYSLLNKTFTLNSLSVHIWIFSYVKIRTFLAKGLSPYSRVFAPLWHQYEVKLFLPSVLIFFPKQEGCSDVELPKMINTWSSFSDPLLVDAVVSLPRSAWSARTPKTPDACECCSWWLMSVTFSEGLSLANWGSQWQRHKSLNTFSMSLQRDLCFRISFVSPQGLTLPEITYLLGAFSCHNLLQVSTERTTSINPCLRLFLGNWT